MEPEKVIEDLESDVESLETDLKQVESQDIDGEMAEKEKRAEKLLEEIHTQLEFLKEQASKGKE